MKCLACGVFEHEVLKRFSDHVKNEHGLSSEEYTIRHLCSGVKPTCAVPDCTNETRYVAYEYKKFCKEHARYAMHVGGAVGGKAEAWSKGKTKDTDERLAAQAERSRGEGNAFFGKKHTEETRTQISLSKQLNTSNLEERIVERSSELTLLTPLTDYVSRQRQYLEFECTQCHEVMKKTLQAFERGSRCYRCYPVSKSNWELSVLSYVKSRCPDAEAAGYEVMLVSEG